MLTKFTRLAVGLFALSAFASLTPSIASPAPKHGAAIAPTFDVVEKSIPELQAAMRTGRVTSRELVALYLQRIALYEDKLHAALAVNPKALSEAEALDHERAAGHVRGPLHGIPIALKDNIQMFGMPTTAGGLAFDGFMAPYEATLVSNLRAAGAVILAKTTMTELANWIASGMPTNYNAIAGYGFNPYDPRRDPREATADGRPALATGGSSSGIGTAASLWAANVGTETSGSILSPANQTMLVGIKPTVGRISRHGIVPITADQDTAGPLARTVTDAAILLGALESASPDVNDAASTRCPPPPDGDYTRFLERDALRGARLGIPRAFFYDPTTPPGGKEPSGGLTPERAALMAEAIAILRAAGATIVDPADIPSVIAKDAASNLLSWNVCAGLDNSKGKDADCSTVFKYGMKRDFEAWLGSLGPGAPVHSLGELRTWNVAHQKMGALKYGQAQLDISDEMDVKADAVRYRSDREKDLRLSAEQGIDAALSAQKLDALIFPGPGGAAIAAKPGYPTVIVPFGMVPNAPTPAFPAGFDAKPAPFGVSFTGTACSEPRLLALAYAFEQASHRRLPPSSTP
ncbi:MAG: amidase family protein [Acidobacteriota bacterium]